MGPTAYTPPGWLTIIPRLFVSDVIEVFGADVTVNRGGPTEVTLAGSMLMVSDGRGIREQSKSFLYVYVPEVDAVFGRAVKAGSRADGMRELGSDRHVIEGVLAVFLDNLDDLAEFTQKLGSFLKDA